MKWKPWIAVSVLLLAIAPVAQAEVHKCVVKGTTVYQDEPCAEGTQAELKANFSDGGTYARGSAQEISAKLRVAYANLSDLQQRMNVESAEVRAQYGYSSPATRAELDQVNQKYQPQIAAVQAKISELNYQQVQRCSSGATVVQTTSRNYNDIRTPCSSVPSVYSTPSMPPIQAQSRGVLILPVRIRTGR